MLREQNVASLSVFPWLTVRGHKFHMDEEVQQEILQWFRDKEKELSTARVQKFVARWDRFCSGWGLD